MDNIREKFLSQFCSFSDTLKLAMESKFDKFTLGFLPIAQLDKVIHAAGFLVTEDKFGYTVTI